jgi:hypothetical protein
VYKPHKSHPYHRCPPLFSFSLLLAPLSASHLSTLLSSPPRRAHFPHSSRYDNFFYFGTHSHHAAAPFLCSSSPLSSVVPSSSSAVMRSLVVYRHVPRSYRRTAPPLSVVRTSAAPATTDRLSLTLSHARCAVRAFPVSQLTTTRSRGMHAERDSRRRGRAECSVVHLLRISGLQRPSRISRSSSCHADYSTSPHLRHRTGSLSALSHVSRGIIPPLSRILLCALGNQRRSFAHRLSTIAAAYLAHSTAIVGGSLLSRLLSCASSSVDIAALSIRTLAAPLSRRTPPQLRIPPHSLHRLSHKRFYSPRIARPLLSAAYYASICLRRY